MKSDFDIVIIGAGLVGLTTALACAHAGASVALLDRREIDRGTDGRASALSTASLTLFKNLEVHLSDDLQPISDMLVTEGVPNSPWRLHFEGDGDGKDLGALIENPALKAALLERVNLSENIALIAPVSVEVIIRDATGAQIETNKGLLTARLVVAADGRESVIRKKAGITAQTFAYDSASLVTTLAHTRPHDGLAWQRIIQGGALALLPLKGNRSQLVWSGPTHSIHAANDLPESAFLDLLTEKMDGYLGDVTLTAPRQNYPLKLQVADSFTAERLALVGDAAHVIHPLAGQGLNLGLKDAAALAHGVKSARETGQDLGIASLLEYDLWRNVDTRAFGGLTHFIAEASGQKFPPFQHARRLGLSLTNQSDILKSVLKKRASGRAQDLPELMQNSL